MKTLTVVLFLASVFALSSSVSALAPNFHEQILNDTIFGDYWVEVHDINQDGLGDVVAVAWGTGELIWWQNPTWEQHLIARVPYVVAIDVADINGDNKTDIVCSYNFTIPMQANETSGGIASWIEQPADPTDVWTVHDIFEVPALHRLLWLPNVGAMGAILAAPLFAAYPDPPVYITASNVTLIFRESADGSQWSRQSIADQLPPLHLIHQLTHAPQIHAETSTVLLGSFEGLAALFVMWDGSGAKYEWLAPGAPLEPYSPYGGVQGADICYLSNSSDYFAYIPTTGPWEGVDILTPMTVSVNRASTNTNSIFGLFSSNLTFENLSVFGPQGHVVKCADFDNDGNDDFIVGQRGPVRDIVYFSCLDSNAESFLWQPLEFSSNHGASGLWPADLNNDGWIDFAATGFPGFGDPSLGDHYVSIFWNNGTNAN